MEKAALSNSRPSIGLAAAGMSDSSASPDASPAHRAVNAASVEVGRGKNNEPTVNVNISQSPKRAGARVDVNVNILKSREADEELS